MCPHIQQNLLFCHEHGGAGKPGGEGCILELLKHWIPAARWAEFVGAGSFGRGHCSILHMALLGYSGVGG